MESTMKKMMLLLIFIFLILKEGQGTSEDEEDFIKNVQQYNKNVSKTYILIAREYGFSAEQVSKLFTGRHPNLKAIEKARADDFPIEDLLRIYDDVKTPETFNWKETAKAIDAKVPQGCYITILNENSEIENIDWKEVNDACANDNVSIKDLAEIMKGCPHVLTLQWKWKEEFKNDGKNWSTDDLINVMNAAKIGIDGGFKSEEVRKFLEINFKVDMKALVKAKIVGFTAKELKEILEIPNVTVDMEALAKAKVVGFTAKDLVEILEIKSGVDLKEIIKYGTLQAHKCNQINEKYYLGRKFAEAKEEKCSESKIKIGLLKTVLNHKVDINLITQALTLQISRYDITEIIRLKNTFREPNDEIKKRIKNKIQKQNKKVDFKTIQDSKYVRGSEHSAFDTLIERNPKINHDELATALNIGFSFEALKEMLKINPEIQIKEGLIKCKEENISEDKIMKILKINHYIDLSAVAKVVSIGFPLDDFLELLEKNANLDTTTLFTIADHQDVTVQDLIDIVKLNSTLDMEGLLNILNLKKMKTEDLKNLLKLNATKDLKILKDAIDIDLEFDQLKLILTKEDENHNDSILKNVFDLIKQDVLAIETLKNSENLAKLIFFQIKEIDIKQEAADVLSLIEHVNIEDLKTLLDTFSNIDWETLKSAIKIGFTSKGLITILKKQEVAILKDILDLINKRNKNDLPITHETLRKNEGNLEILKAIVEFSTVERRK